MVTEWKGRREETERRERDEIRRGREREEEKTRRGRKVMKRGGTSGENNQFLAHWFDLAYELVGLIHKYSTSRAYSRLPTGLVCNKILQSLLSTVLYCTFHSDSANCRIPMVAFYSDSPAAMRPGLEFRYSFLQQSVNHQFSSCHTLSAGIEEQKQTYHSSA